MQKPIKTNPKSINYGRKTLENIKRLGFEFFRLPVQVSDDEHSYPDYTIPVYVFDKLDEIVTWAEEIGLYVILNYHNGLDKNDTAMAKVQARAFWTQMANRYKDRGPYILYEIANEPGKWGRVFNDEQKAGIDAVRAVDNVHTIVVTDGQFHQSSVWGLQKDGDLIYDDNNMIYTVHNYHPIAFTHQGAEWLSGWYADYRGLPYPYNASDYPTTGEATDKEDGYASSVNQASVARSYNRAQDFQEEFNVPVLVGEFGAMKFADLDDRANFIRDSRVAMDNRGLKWAMWDYNGAFGIIKSGYSNDIDHDLYAEIITALGLNPPIQTPRMAVTRSSTFDIYTDAVANWIYLNVGGGLVSIDLYSTEQVNSGSKSIELYRYTPKTSGGVGLLRFYFEDLIDISDNYHDFSIQMKVYVTDDSDMRFFVRLRDDGRGRKKVVVHLAGDALEADHPDEYDYSVEVNDWDGTWKTITIPFSALDPDDDLNSSKLRRLEIGLSVPRLQNGEYSKDVPADSEKIFFDDIKFVLTP